MNFARVQAVLAKELLEIRKNRTLLLTILLPPLLLTLCRWALWSRSARRAAGTT